MAFGQSFNYINYDTDDGLPSSEVYDIEVDEDGSLWFTTDRGLCHYDGYDFKTFTTSDGLLNNTNFEIWKDSTERMWLTAFDGRLSYYENGAFHPFTLNDTLTHLSNGMFINYFAIDQDGALNAILNNGSRITSIISYLSIDLKNKRITRKELSDKNHIATKKNIHFLRGAYNQYQFLHHKGLTFAPYVKTILEDGTSVFYSSSMLLFAKGEQVEASRYPFKSDIGYLYLDRQQRLWVATNGNGLFQFDPKNLHQPLHHFFKGMGITSIVQDQEGSFWISSLEKGVFKVTNFDIEHISLEQSKLRNEKVLGVKVLEDHLIIGTSNSRLLYMDSKQQIKAFDTSSVKGPAYLMENNKQLYSRHGLKIVFKKGQPGVQRYMADNVTAPILLNDSICLVAGHSNYLYQLKWDRKKKIFARSQRIKFGKRITDILQLSDSIIWLATLNGLYYSKEHQIDRFEQHLPEHPLLDTRISQLLELKGSGFWIATMGKGLLFAKDDQIIQYNLSDKPSTELINCLYLQNDTTLWIGGNEGAKKIHFQLDQRAIPQIRQVQSITTVEGLSTNYINDIACWQDRIWLATEEGIDHFPITLQTSTSFTPSIYLEEVRIDTLDFVQSNDPTFQHNQNDIFFRFTGVSYSKPKDDAFYRYRLLKQSSPTPAWAYTNSRDVQYTNLHAGAYQFEVMARNNNDRWSDQAVNYPFTIAPHFTQTWWFRILAVLLSAGLIYGAIRNRIVRVKREEQNKRQLKEAELQALRSQMNPHFVFNSLNSIQNFIFKKDIRQANFYLSKFSRLMRESLQFTKLKYISLEKEIEFIVSYLDLEKMRFPDRFDYQINVQDDILVKSYFVPPLLVQPVLENAVKHAFKNIDYKGILSVDFRQNEKEMLLITITDNGPGIQPNEIGQYKVSSDHQSLGLQIIKDRIKLINREYSSKPASFKIINLNDPPQKQHGTQAIFTLPLDIEMA